MGITVVYGVLIDHIHGLLLVFNQKGDVFDVYEGYVLVFYNAVGKRVDLFDFELVVAHIVFFVALVAWVS